MSHPAGLQRVTPFLMFQGGVAEEAIGLYVATIPDSRIVDIRRFGPEMPGAEGKIMMARVLLGGQTVIMNDSPVPHAFTFTPSTSLFVTCETADELDRIAGTLSEGGAYLMPIGAYGFSQRFAWLADRFGVSWQLSFG